jgi:hypothetical protein
MLLQDFLGLAAIGMAIAGVVQAFRGEENSAVLLLLFGGPSTLLWLGRLLDQALGRF